MRVQGAPEKNIKKVFFPTRAVHYTGKDQLDRSNESNKPLFEENERDRAMLTAFHKYVTSVQGDFDVDALEFGCMAEEPHRQSGAEDFVSQYWLIL